MRPIDPLIARLCTIRSNAIRAMPYGTLAREVRVNVCDALVASALIRETRAAYRESPTYWRREAVSEWIDRNERRAVRYEYRNIL